MIGALLLDRYRIDLELGQGGMGTVYRAHDTLLDRPVAVKVLTASGLGTEGRSRLLGEAQAAARLNHPNIVAVHDAGIAPGADDLAFIVMELVEGQPLRPGKVHSQEETLSIGRQVCAALEHAHAAGVIHRDLKPENIILTRTRTVKLMDFGLARSVHASRLTEDGALVGTFFYLAPELILGQPASPQSDLYALGVMLYELLTGRPPFEGDTLAATLSQHLHATAVPPSTYNPEMPPALEAVILRLLSKQPGQRPASAAETRQALEAVGVLEAALERSASEAEWLGGAGDGMATLDRLVRGRLVGRDLEMEEAQALWRRSVAGEGGTLLVSGEPGIGKTRLVRELSALAEVSGAAALLGECYAEGGAPYAPVAQVIQAALADGRPARLPASALPALALADLLTVAPALRIHYPDTPPNPPLDPASEQQRLFESVFELCAQLAARAPLLLVIDDVHWADGGSLTLLRHLARRIRSARLRLLLVLTYREVELGEGRALNDMLADLNRERLAARLKLTRLGRESTRALLEAMLAEAVAPEFLDGIYRETEGNPFFIEEVCKALVESGALRREGGHWHWPEATDIQVPQSVRVAIQSRTGKLPAPAQDALRLAAVIGREFDFTVLQQASDLDEEALIDALELAERAQLLGEVAGRGGAVFAFAHALIPSTLRESVGGLRRQRLHRRVAAAIETVRPQDFATLAYHYDEAGDEAAARLGYLRAGDQARAVFANDDALRFYTEALALFPEDDPQRFDVLAARAAVCDLTARRDMQRADVQAMLSLAEQLNDDRRRVEALLAQSDLEVGVDLLKTLAPAQRAVELARRHGDPLWEARALLRLGWAHYFHSEPQLALQALEAASAGFKQAGQLSEAAACLNRLALVQMYQLSDAPAAQRAAEEAVALSRQAGDRAQQAVSLRRLAMVLEPQKRYTEALPLLEQALALSRALGNRAEERAGLYNRGWLLARLRRFDESERDLREALALAEAIGDPLGVTNSVSMLMRFHHLRRGEYQAALELFDGYLDQDYGPRQEILVEMLRANRVLPLVLLGRYEAALEDLDSAFALARKSEGEVVQANFLSTRAQILALLGRFTEARQDAGQALRMVEPSGTPSDIAYKWATLALVDLLEGESRGEPALFRDGAAQMQRALTVLREREPLDDWNFFLDIAAALHSHLGELEAALMFSDELMGCIATAPHVTFLEKHLLNRSRLLRALGRESEADELLRQAWERAQLISGHLQAEALRHSWLETEDIRGILADARARGQAG